MFQVRAISSPKALIGHVVPEEFRFFVQRLSRLLLDLQYSKSSFQGKTQLLG
jgi:hypothetical protein